MNSILNDNQKRRIFQLKKDGFTQQKIADLFGVSQSTVSNVLKQQQEMQEDNEYLLLYLMGHDGYKEWDTAIGILEVHEKISNIFYDIDIESSVIQKVGSPEFISMYDFLCFIYHNNLIPVEDRLFDMEDL